MMGENVERSAAVAHVGFATEEEDMCMGVEKPTRGTAVLGYPLDLPLGLSCGIWDCLVSVWSSGVHEGPAEITRRR